MPKGVPNKRYTPAGSGCIYMIVRRELKPLEELARQVSDLSVDNIDSSIRVQVTGDEVEQLSTALDGMAHRVSDAYMVQKNFSANSIRLIIVSTITEHGISESYQLG